MTTPRRNWNHIVRSCGWVLLGGLAVWLATENVSALKPRQVAAGSKPAKFNPNGKTSAIDSLDLKQILARAEQNHPAIRAAEARLASARAELDQARLQVAEEVLETRKQWRSAKAVVTTAQAELQAAGSLKGDRQRELIRTARERLKIAREQLAATEVRLALLIGKAPTNAKKPAGGSEREKHLRQLRAISQQMVKVAIADWRIGRADTALLFTATRRLARIDFALAKTKAQKLDAIKAYVIILNDLQKIATQRFRTGKGSHAAVLAIQYAIAEAELWKLDLK